MNKRFGWLDYWRFIAAFSVMMFHYTANSINNGEIELAGGFGGLQKVTMYGYLGVDVFFIISGFVILLSAVKRRPSEFIVSRAVRIFPAFLLCMTVTTIVIVSSGSSDVTLMRYLINLTMVPTHLGYEPMDGVYWSLAFEIFFYAVLFAIMLAGLIKQVRGFLMLWTITSYLLLFLGVDVFGFGGFFSLFASGCALYLYYADKNYISLLLFIACAILSILGVYDRAAEILQSGRFLISPILASSIVVVIFCFFYAFMRYWGNQVDLPYSSAIGAMTYPLYLIHNVVGIWLFQSLGDTYNRWVILVAVVVFVVAISYLINRFFERPTLGYWYAIFDFLAGKPVRVTENLFSTKVQNRRVFEK